MPNCSMLRRELLAYCAIAGALPSAEAAEEAWKPTRTVEVVVGVSPGGSMDRTARSVEDALFKAHFIPRSSVVLNRPGGGHAVALSYTVSHRGDANVIQVVNSSLITNKILGRGTQDYADATPLATLFFEQMLFAVNKDSPIKQPLDLVDRLKADPTTLSFAVSSGIGTTNELAGLMLAKAAGIDPKQLKAVSFNSASEGTSQTLGGHIDVLITTPFSIVPFILSGDLRPLAVAADERLGGVLKDVPTWKELGMNSVAPGFRVVIGPPGLAASQVGFWETACQAITATPQWQKQIDREFLTAHYLNGADTLAFLKNEAEIYTSFFRSIGII